jgi:curved DNA-binding protein CbpA
MKWKNLDTTYKDQLEQLKAKSPYDRLGVSFGATMPEVKKAYRSKMSLYHPDRTDDFMSIHGEEITKLLNEAVKQIKREIG